MNNRFETNKGLLPKFQHEQKFLGVCIGWVIDNKDPDKQGRVKLKVPWLRNAESDDEDFTTDWNQGLIDHVALRLTGKRLSAKQNRVALDMLAKVDEDMESSERVGLVIAFVLQMPAANTN